MKPFIIPIFIPHSGCPHQCIFCDQQAISGTPQKIPDASEIIEIIDTFIQYRKNTRTRTEVSFYGGNFLGLDSGKIKYLLDAVISCPANETIDGIRFSTRPDTIDRKRLALIRDYPVSTVELGVQSMDDRVLARAGRGHTSADTKNAVMLLKQENYDIGLQMMTGLPGDTEALSLMSAKAMIDLAPDFVRIYPTLVISGSPLADLYRAGKYTPIAIDACVSQVKRLYQLFEKNRIRVIRMGLQASDDLDDPATVLAGPYHPAFGHLVFSEMFFDRAIERIQNCSSIGDAATLTVHPKSVSRMQGLRKENINKLKQMFNLKKLAIRIDPSLAQDDVVLE